MSILESLKNLDLKLIVDISIALTIVSFTFAIKKPLSIFLLKKIFNLFFKNQDISENFNKPLSNFIFTIGLFFAIDFIPMVGKTSITINSIAKSFMMFSVFHAIVLITPLAVSFFYKNLIQGVQDWIVRILRLFILCIGLTSILNIWGIQIAPIIAGFGVLGAGISFAAKDFFENIISGIVIMSEQKFNIGDLIKIGNIAEGHVTNIRIRSTEVLQRDKSPIFIPNAKIANSSIINFTKMKTRMIKLVVKLDYSTKTIDLLKIRDNIFLYISDANFFRTSTDLNTYVKILEFGDWSVDMHIQCFTKTNSFDDFLDSKERLNVKVNEIVTSNNSSFAFPTQNLNVCK